MSNACTESVTCIIKPANVSKVSFTLRSVHIHLVTKFVIRAVLRIPTKFITLAETEWKDYPQTVKVETNTGSD